MRVAIVSESFLPQVNGLTNSVCRVLEHLAAHGHEAMVIAPGPCPASHAGFPVHATPAFRLPFYRSFRVGLPSREIRCVLEEFEPDVVHLASPTVVGASGMTAAARLGVPAVAVYPDRPRRLRPPVRHARHGQRHLVMAPPHPQPG
ncbi:glycosyltransferase [Planotetraspora sp. A-T 1434]|uniref:glycosyltransferase n=1 Tax=Planotetraspora sp. A-T 1434 TaxID=2979219 RepID=UPI0021C18ACC|nr:glycosyltransferase [Planotetraspora sp. A-T 1434]MCT9933481.1 glycosyltransferase [Planotetraspora sp. A-T 1434]